VLVSGKPFQPNVIAYSLLIALTYSLVMKKMKGPGKSTYTLPVTFHFPLSTTLVEPAGGGGGGAESGNPPT